MIGVSIFMLITKSSPNQGLMRECKDDEIWHPKTFQNKLKNFKQLAFKTEVNSNISKFIKFSFCSMDTKYNDNFKKDL